MLSKKQAGKATVQQNDAIRYMDGSSLSRPQKIGGFNLVLGALFVAIAVAVGGFVIWQYFDKVVNVNAENIEAVEHNLSRDIPLDAPKITSFAKMNADEIRAKTNDLDYIYVDLTSDEYAGAGGVDLFALPTDLDEASGKTLLNKGISKLNAVEASALLYGSWRVSKEPESYTDMRIRYVDFKAGNVSTAIANAVATQGFDVSKDTESGTDESGNSYQSGVEKIGKKKYNWRVSAISLSDVYDIKGLPETAIYVGVRLTAQA